MNCESGLVKHGTKQKITMLNGNLVVKSKPPPWSGTSLKAVEPHP